MPDSSLIPCPVCGKVSGKNLRFRGCQDWEYGISGTWDINQCQECKTQFLDPMPLPEDLVRYYPASYHSYHRPASWITRMLWNMMVRRKIAHLYALGLHKGRFLDVGCADGFLIRQIEKQSAFKGAGVEFNPVVAARGKKEGSDIVTGTLEQAGFADAAFDVVIMDHLLEHVIEPYRTLQEAARIVVPGGFVIGETPNTDSWDAYLGGRYWGGMHTPRHVCLLCPQSIALLAGRCGLTVHSMTPSLHTGHWAGTVQNFIERINKGANLVEGRGWYYPAFLCAFIPVNALQYLLHKTGVISFVLQKPGGRKV